MLAIPPPTQLTLVDSASIKPMDQHPVLAYLSRLGSPGSQKTMMKRLKAIVKLLQPTVTESTVQTFPWENLRYQHVSMLRSLLVEEEFSESTINTTLSALRGVLKECWRLNLISHEEYQRAADVENLKFTRLPVGRVLTQEEFSRLWQTCADDRTVNGLRDLTLLAIARAGLRRSEIVNVHVAHFLQDGTLKVVKGKGNKDRTTYVLESVIPVINEWLDFRGNEPGPLLLPVTNQQKVLLRYKKSKRGETVMSAMTDQAVWDILSKRGEQAKIPDFSPHDLRRTFITDLLYSGVDVVTVQRLAGHSDPKTTALYDRRGEDAKRNAVQKLFVPN